MELETLKSQAELKFNSVKAEALALSSQCNAINITDDVSLSMATQTLSKAAKVVSEVGKVRESLKKPHLEAGRTIDSIAKSITNSLDIAIADGREKLREWNNKANEAAKKEEIENNKIADYLQQTKSILEQKVSISDTPEKCRALIDSINKNFPPFESFKKYATEAKTIKESFIILLKNKQEILSIEGTNLSTIAPTIEASKNIREVVAAIEEKKETIASSIVASTSNTMKRWTYNITDESKLPREFLSPDSKKINEYLKAHKDEFDPEGTIMNGITFFQDTIPVIR